MKIKVRRTENSPVIKIPEYKSEGASGFDLHAAIDRSIELGPGNRNIISTGLSFEIPEGYELQIRPRSGLAGNHGVATFFGTIDSDYRGEVKIILVNYGRTNYSVSPGDRIAQAVVCPILRVEFEEVEELSETTRGKSGFGSTGRR